MNFRMELVLVLVALASCLAQDISYPENKNEDQESKNRFGEMLPPWFLNFMPKENQNPLQGNQPGPTLQATERPLRTPPKSTQDVITLVPCRCPFTSEYSPVCGSDGQSYGNLGILNCYRTCGYDLTMVRAAACSQIAGIKTS